jgi:hypothetical protein
MSGPIVVLIAIVAVLMLFDVVALRWGVDSRPGLPDDHRR